MPYNSKAYLDAKVSMTNHGTVDAGRQMQSPASAGSRGLAKTTQFTNNKTQMQLGQEAIAESMVDIRNIMNRIDGINVPTNEMNELADDDKMEFTKLLLDISVIKDRVQALSVDEDAKASAIQSLTSAEEALVALDETAVKEDDESYGYEWECSNCGTENEFVMTPQERAQYIKDWEEDNQDLVADGETGLDALNNLLDTGAESGMHYGQKCIKCGTDATNPYQNEDELGRLKELSGIEEDTSDDIMQWAKKYSQYKNLEDDNLIEALYEYAFELGIAQLTFEVGELQAAERKLGKKQEDWEDKEINAAMEMSPISNGLLDDLHRILPGNADLEQKLDSIRGMLEKAGLKEDKYQPFPEGDEFDIEEDEDFEEVLGPLGFPEDETELFDAEYQGRKVPLNKPMRGDVKKFKVYVKDPKTGNVKKVNFGHGGTSAKKAGQKTMKIRKSNPKARKSFRARHNCANPGSKTKARYWSCRAW